MSGYVHCACGTCFEIAIASDDETEALCLTCKTEGCEPGQECQCPPEEDDE